MNRPENQMIDVNVYKESGKWYASGKATVNHFLFEDGFRQDIVDTQDIVHGLNEFYVVTSVPEHVNGFFEALYKPGAFSEFTKRSDNNG